MYTDTTMWSDIWNVSFFDEKCDGLLDRYYKTKIIGFFDILMAVINSELKDGHLGECCLSFKLESISTNNDKCNCK